MEYAYELETPNPLTMSGGLYTTAASPTAWALAAITYFGDVMAPDKNAITLNFTPQRGARPKSRPPTRWRIRIELIPDGGWQAWLTVDARPRGCTATRPSASPPVRVSRCSWNAQIVMGNTCGLRNANGDEVPLQVAATLPSGIDGRGNQAVLKRPLRLDGEGTELFQPLFYVNDRPGTLRLRGVARRHGRHAQPAGQYRDRAWRP